MLGEAAGLGHRLGVYISILPSTPALPAEDLDKVVRSFQWPEAGLAWQQSRLCVLHHPSLTDSLPYVELTCVLTSVGQDSPASLVHHLEALPSVACPATTALAFLWNTVLYGRHLFVVRLAGYPDTVRVYTLGVLTENPAIASAEDISCSPDAPEEVASTVFTSGVAVVPGILSRETILSLGSLVSTNLAVDCPPSPDDWPATSRCKHRPETPSFLEIAQRDEGRFDMQFIPDQLPQWIQQLAQEAPWTGAVRETLGPACKPVRMGCVYSIP
eukprot:gene4209-4514_t